MIKMNVFAGACNGKSRVLCISILTIAIIAAKADPLAIGCLRVFIAFTPEIKHINVTKAIADEPNTPNSNKNWMYSL